MDEVHAVWFDLDGTLADTAPDLTHALNTLLVQEGLEPLSVREVRPHVSHGSVALIQRGFGLGQNDPGGEALRHRLLQLYRDRLCHDTTLFPGMETLISSLEQLGVKWGVVTNKPAFLTDPLMSELGLSHRAACIVSGDTTCRTKPHPDSLLHACKLSRTSARNCIMVGDAERDIEAGRRAGMKTLVALFGYIHANDHPQQWGADGMLSAPTDLLSWVDLQRRT
ncbi:MAG: HAD-IA family hydrolase [Gammaproteobacteria bacterium]|nr:HAD-IA family hydrolase [Gammaproteobacteria bacterium]